MTRLLSILLTEADEMIHLPPKERFTTMGEAKTLSVAEVRSYQYAADSMTKMHSVVVRRDM